MPRVVDRCRNGDAVVTAEYCTRALYGAIINMQRMKFSDFPMYCAEVVVLLANLVALIAERGFAI